MHGKRKLVFVLSNDVEAAELDWSKRLDTIKGTNYALSHMHHDCNPPIVCHDVTRTNFYVELRIRGLFFFIFILV